MTPAPGSGISGLTPAPGMPSIALGRFRTPMRNGLQPMLHWRQYIWTRSCARRLGVGVMLASYLVTVVGVPLPASGKFAGQAFPCQNHRCGCRTAEECWSGCCCFSPAERLAWATAHGIRPPAYAETAGKGWCAAKLRDREVVQSGKKPACPHCVHDARTPPMPAARDPHSSACCSQSATETPAETKDTRWVPGVRSLACRGLSTLWTTSGAVLPPPRAVTWSFCFDASDHLRNFDVSAFSHDCIPPDPPPRLLHA